MASLTKRKELVNELRKAHFPFGFEGSNNISEYKKQYLQHAIAQNEIKNSKGNNFSIGSDEPAMGKNTYVSQFKEKYAEYGKEGKRQKGKNTNDQNNIVFGYYDNGEKITNYKDNFIKKGEYKKNNDIDKQRVGHIELGDTLTKFTTTYNDVYDKKQPIKSQKVYDEPRKSNLMLGKDESNFLTSNNVAYGSKQVVFSSAPKRNYDTNIDLGSHQVSYCSEHEQHFHHKPNITQGVDKQKVLDFKKAHFQFGFPQEDKSNYQSQAQFHYSQKPLNTELVEGKKTSNIQLKFDDENYFQSSYKNHYQELVGEKAEILNRNGRATNVIIGSDQYPYESEAKAQFSSKDGERAKAVKTEGKLTLGDIKVDYKTHNQDVYTNKFQNREDNRLGKNQIDKLKQVNYVNGFSQHGYQLHSQSYGNKSGGTNKLPREVIDKMRGTNIVDGDDHKFKGTTTHQSEYHWKKNNDF